MSAALRLRRPFDELSPIARSCALRALGAATAGVLIPLLGAEREMTRTGGPGIIAFELAGTDQRATRIMRRWGDDGRAAARRSLILDYPFLIAYAPLQALACNAVSEKMRRRRQRKLAAAGAPVAWAQLAAGGFDATENAALLMTLAKHDRPAPVDGRLPAVARACAITKFSLLTAGWAYCLLAFATRRTSRSSTPPTRRRQRQPARSPLKCSR
ncbi:MAG: hypothetical protein ACYCUM_14180 [Solirubrobacteraceae bacterium]